MASQKDIQILIDLAVQNQQSLDQLNQKLGHVQKSTGDTGMQFVKLDSIINLASKGFRMLQNVMGGVINVMGKAITSIKGMAEESAQMSVQIDTLGIIAKARGEDVDGFQQAAKDLGMELRLGTGPAAEALQKLMKSGLNLQQSTELLKRFTNEAITGKVSTMSLSEAVVNLAGGYQMEMSALMDRAGISENISSLMEKEARLQGVQIANLDEMARNQLKYDAYIRLTNETLGSAEQFVGSYIDRQNELNIIMQETRREIGEQFLPVFSLFQEAQIAFLEIITPSNEALDEMGETINTIVTEMMTMLTGSEELGGAVMTLQEIIDNFIINTAEWLLQKWNELKQAIEDNSGSIEEMWNRIDTQLVPALNDLLGITDENIEGTGNWADKLILALPAMISFITKLVELIDKFTDLLKLITDINNKVESFVGAMNKIAPSYAMEAVFGNPKSFSKGGIVYAQGGFVSRGTDTVPAMLTPGEMVVPRDLTQQLASFIKKANTGITININAPMTREQAQVTSQVMVNQLLNYQLGS